MSDGEYTPEGIGIIKAYINSGNLSYDCEQEFMFEVAVNSMLVSKDYKTAASYFARLDKDRFPESADYLKLCSLQSGFEYDPEVAVNVTGKLFADIVKRSPSKMKYENLIFIALCYENYDRDRSDGLKKAISVLKIARDELAYITEKEQGGYDKEDAKKMKNQVEDLIIVKERRLKMEKKGGTYEVH